MPRPHAGMVGAMVAALVFIGAPAAAGPAAEKAAERAVDALAPLVKQRHASGAQWRTDLAAELDRLPKVNEVRHLSGAVGGDIIAGTARLADGVELNSDVTIVARQILLERKSLRIKANGHTIRLYPVEALKAEAGTASLLTFDLSGSRGSDGTQGGQGLPGFDGFGGMPGQGATLCTGNKGGTGGEGDAGDAGGDGFEGSAGTDAGSITFDVPDGSVDTYRFLARGGDGGRGGTGGGGGNGGRGGDGGPGAPGEDWPNMWCSGGEGGDGGAGGNGGNGGTGGAGGSGGNGGTVTVTFPGVGYNPAGITVETGGGSGGGGGPGGFPGQPGNGGSGGPGGSPAAPWSGDYGAQGSSGQGGQMGSSSSGSNGSSGSSGSSSVTARNSGYSVSVNPVSATLNAGETVTVTVNTARLNGAPPQAVNLSAAGLPAGANASFNPASLMTGGSATMTITTGASTPAGLKQVIVTAAGGGATASTPFGLNVLGPITGCSFTNHTDRPIGPVGSGEDFAGGVFSPIAIRGCGQGTPMTATVDVHIVTTYRGSVTLDLFYPNGAASLLRAPNFNDHGSGILQSFRVSIVMAVPTDGTWNLWAKDLYGGTGYIDYWTLTFTPIGTPVTLTAIHSGKCLDVSTASQADGAAIWQWTCHGGTNQQWRIVPSGPGTFAVVAVHSGKCLDLSPSNADGGTIHQWTCHGGTNQQWGLSMPLTEGSPVTLVNAYSGRCLDVSGVSPNEGAIVWQWTCHYGQNQQWQVHLLR